MGVTKRADDPTRDDKFERQKGKAEAEGKRPTTDDEVQEAILTVFRETKKDEGLWGKLVGKDKVPDVKKLEEALGYPVSAEERDRALKTFNAEQVAASKKK